MARREQKRLSQPLPRSRARYAMTPHSLAGEMTSNHVPARKNGKRSA